MNYSALQTDLTARGFPAGGDPTAAANALNALTVSVVGLVSTSQLLIWAASNGILGTIQALSQNTTSPLQSAAIAVMLVANGGLPGIDLSSAAVQAMVGGFVNAGIVTQAQANALTALGTTTTSYVQQTYGVAAIGAADVLTAWRQS